MARSRADYADLANIEAEASVLGAVYCRPELIYEVADELKPEAFYREAHRLLYTVMLKLAQDHKSVDIVSTTEELRDEGLLNRVGGIQFVTHVANSEPTSAYWKQHAEIVKAYALWERALMYDWCLSGGDYSLVAYTDRMTPMFLESYQAR